MKVWVVVQHSTIDPAAWHLCSLWKKKEDAEQAAQKLPNAKAERWIVQ